MILETTGGVNMSQTNRMVDWLKSIDESVPGIESPLRRFEEGCLANSPASK